MRSSYLSLPEMIDELRSLTRSKATGTFFVVSDEQHSAMFGLKKGRLVALQCRLRFGENAIPLIAKIKQGSCNFKNTLNYVRGIDVTDNEDIFQEILSLYEGEMNNSLGLQRTPRSEPAEARRVLSLTPDQQSAISRILIDELGPVGSILMDSLVKCADFDAMVTILKREIDKKSAVRATSQRIKAVLSV